MLLPENIDANVNVLHEDSPLLEIVLGQGMWKYAEIVIKHGADTNVPMDSFGQETPIYYAIEHCQWGTVALLVQHGASLTEMSFYFEETPLLFYMTRFYPDIDIEIVKLLMPPRTTGSYIDGYRAIMCLIVNTSCDEYNCAIVKYLLLNLSTLELESITLDLDYGMSCMKVNGKSVALSFHTFPKAVCMEMDMLCYVLQETCVSKTLTINIDDDCPRVDKDAISKQLDTLSDSLTRHPPSLFKLAALTVKQKMTGHDNSDFDALGLPMCVVCKLKWEELATELYSMWRHYLCCEIDVSD